jgi:molecular chaperone GrpE
MNGDDYKDQTGASEEVRAGTTRAPENGTRPSAAETLDEHEALRREVAEWKAKSDEWLDQYRRSIAEFANYRKRQEREKQQQTVRLSIEVMQKLLPIVDDLQRAIKNVPQELAGVSWVQGIDLIAHKVESVLTEFQVVPIQALGTMFDPNFHASLMQAESDAYPAGTILEELQTGYMLGDQVLRPTLVKVSSGPGPRH